MSNTPLKRTCDTAIVHQRLLREDPGYRPAREKIERRARTYDQDTSRVFRGNGITQIPTVVHIVWKTAEQNITASQVKSQIDVLNQDFRMKNTDIESVPSVWQSLVGDTRIEFFLAEKDPNGNPTNGITRTHTTVDDFTNDDDVKFSRSGGVNAWPADKYLNIWVCQLRNNLLGYAQFPGGQANTDGIVILHSAFGTEGTATPPFDKGRTTTHEVGHWLNLYHIWGDDGSACQGSDGVNDTPNSAGPNNGCPDFPQISCNNAPNGDMFMNYMDYTNDLCMCMFTHGQIARMQATLHGWRSSLGRSESNLHEQNFGYSEKAGKWRVERHPRFLADLTGNNRVDVVGFHNDGVYTALNAGDGSFQIPQRVLSDFNYDAGWRVEKHPRFLADLTGDNKADIIGFYNDGVYVALNMGNGFFQTSKRVLKKFGYESGDWRTEKYPRFLADLTGDNRADIIGFGHSGVYVALNNGNGSFQEPQKILDDFGYEAGEWRVNKHPRFLTDLTGNNSADIIGFHDDGVYIALNEGNGYFQSSQQVLTDFCYENGWEVDKHPRFLADLTGNNRADIVGFYDDGVYVSLNNGDGSFKPPKLVLDFFGYEKGGWRINFHPRFLSDVTGDNRADIIGFHNDGVYVALNNGDGSFQEPQKVLENFGYQAGGWRVEQHPRHLADLIGNNKADIVGFGYSGIYVALNKGNGTFRL